jgi:hypothetical protein
MGISWMPFDGSPVSRGLRSRVVGASAPGRPVRRCCREDVLLEDVLLGEVGVGGRTRTDDHSIMSRVL